MDATFSFESDLHQNIWHASATEAHRLKKGASAYRALSIQACREPNGIFGDRTSQSTEYKAINGVKNRDVDTKMRKISNTDDDIWPYCKMSHREPGQARNQVIINGDTYRVFEAAMVRREIADFKKHVTVFGHLAEGLRSQSVDHNFV